ncbi:hypothetical protein B0J14DRAFT_648707 [Halenospora varia]|nr:hypothetical protein B0J14DRAFT_648707 [Halenospora varia]
MQLLNIVTGIALATTTVLAVALPEGLTPSARELVPGRKTGVLQIRGNIGGIEYTGNGTLEQVFAQFKKDHPAAAAKVEAEHAAYLANTTDFEARSALTTRNMANIWCCNQANFGWDWQDADFGPVRYDEAWLRTLTIRGVSCGVEAHDCARITCNDKAGVHFCNDTDHKIDASCWYLADYVLNIYNTCNDLQCGLGLCRYNGVCGQQFDTDGYNVIVRRDNDC